MNAAPTEAWMRSRPLVLPALALWGWQADLLPVALGLGALLEAPRFLPQRLDIAQRDFERLWSFTSVLFLAVVFYLLLARQGLGGFSAATGLATEPPAEGGQDRMHRVSDTALTFLRWFPFVLFPFALAHAWSRSLTLPWSTFSLYEQARAKREPGVPPPEWAGRPMHPGYLYVGAVLFASTTTAAHTLAYMPLLVVALVMALWPWRNRRYGIVSWVLLLSVVTGIALLAQRTQHAARDAWQAVENQLASSGGGADFEQSHVTMAIGRVGALKQSGGIILRVTTEDGDSPGLLREAVFNRFRGATWDSARRAFEPFERTLPPAPQEGLRAMTISRYVEGTAVPVAAPGDVREVHPRSPMQMEANDLAALRLRTADPLVMYEVVSGAGGGFAPAPQADDTSLAPVEPADRELIRAVAAEAGLSAELSAAVNRDRLEAWFARGFTYSLWQERRPDGITPLAHFLRTSRSGHCEYYATATALLLRAAGVPTRYAVGFSVDELRGDTWVARGRDAHAWCLAWIDGRWQDVDTTPGSWRSAESAGIGWWEHASDRISEAWYAFAVWRQYGGNWRLVVFIAGMVVLAWIAWRQLRGSRWRRAVAPATAGDGLTLQGLDSEFFAVLVRLAELHEPRPAYETVQAWTRRLVPYSSTLAAPLREACALHQRLRFDPAGLTSGERSRLQTVTAELQRELRVAPQGSPRR